MLVSCIRSVRTVDAQKQCCYQENRDNVVVEYGNIYPAHECMFEAVVTKTGVSAPPPPVSNVYSRASHHCSVMAGINFRRKERNASSKRDRHQEAMTASPHHRDGTAHRTPIGGRGPRLLWLLCAEFSESICALSPLWLALALPVRLRTWGPILGG